MMYKVTEIDLIQFEAESDRKLLEATEARFAEERKQLLLQIQDLSTQSAKNSTNDRTNDVGTSATRSYSEVVASPTSSWLHVRAPVTKPTISTASRHTPVGNRFSVLVDEAVDLDVTSPPRVSSKPSDTSNTSTNTKPRNQKSSISQGHNSKKQKTDSIPCVVILGDSISKRIDGNRLSRSAQVNNKSEGGRRIEQVCKDVDSHSQLISTADSVIVHVGTNNLKSDSLDVIQNKFVKLSDKLKVLVDSKCEVALSSIIPRTEFAAKVDAVNEIIYNICEDNKWSYIDNAAVTDLGRDKLHPDKKGLSFLARNYQDFLRCAHPHLFRHGHKRHQRMPPVGNQLPPWLKLLMGMAQ
ncbi:uncharacterized protein [Amphiura filiformis]|uniref:uncharacterized protein n=1 Tax=Amphiura filiformis TaxID=82378 RepID=UPI003B21C2D9